MQDYAPDPYGDGNPEQRYDGDSGVGASASAADLIEHQPSKTFGRPPPGVPPPIGYSQENSESNPVYLRMANAWGVGNVEFDPDTGSWVTVSKSKSKKGGAPGGYPAGMMPGMPAMPYGMYGQPMMPPYPGMMPGMYSGAMPPMYPGMMPPAAPMMPPAESTSKEDMKRQAKKEMKKLLRKEQEEEERRAEKEARRRRKKEDKLEEKARREEERSRREEEEQHIRAREAAEAHARERARLDQERVVAQQAALKRQEHEAKMRAKQIALEKEVEARRLAKEREEQERQDWEGRERARQRALRGVEEAARLGAHTPTSTRNSWLSESSHVPPYTPYEDEGQEYRDPETHSQRSYGNFESRSDSLSGRRTPRTPRSSSPQSYNSKPPSYRSNPSSRNGSEDSYKERSSSGDWVDDASDARSVRSTSSSRRRDPMESASQHLETPQPLFKFNRQRAVSSSNVGTPRSQDLSDSRSLRSTRSGGSRTPSGTSSSQSTSGFRMRDGSLRSDSSRLPSYNRAGQSHHEDSTSFSESTDSRLASSYVSSSSSRLDRPRTSRSRSTPTQVSNQGNDVGDWDFGTDDSGSSSKASSLPYKMDKLHISKTMPQKVEAASSIPPEDDDDEEAIYVRSDGRSRSMTSSMPSSYFKSDDTRSIRSGRSANSYLSARPPPSRRYT